MKMIKFMILVLLMFQFVYSQSGWQSINFGITNDFYRTNFLNLNTGYLGGNTNGNVFKTTNGGFNWDSIRIGSSNDWIQKIQFLNNDTGFVICEFQLFKTTNAAIDWNYTNLNHEIGTFYFVNANTGYCGSEESGFPRLYKLYKTTDSGITWNTIFTNYDQITSIQFINDSTGYFTLLSRLYKTQNYGNTWSYNLTGGTSNQKIISFFDNGVGYIKDYTIGNKIMKTTNDGLNWIQIIVPSYGVFFANSNTGYTTGLDKRIYKTLNGGINWYIQITSPHILFDIFMVNETIGYAVGESGTILKTIDGGGAIGIIQFFQQIPKAHELNQNYPNPFNPATKIKFSIPKSSQVKIVVYDLLGKEIETIVNQQLNPGIYETAFDGMKLSSGVYFYKLTTEDYTETKKMLLIK